MAKSSTSEVGIVTIGDEILIGQIIDTNSSWLGRQLAKLGLSVTHRFSVGDHQRDIIDALERASDGCALVLVTGGLGPTRDDKTKTAIGEFFGVGSYFDQENYDWITEVFAKYGRKPQESHRQQCFLPKGCVKLQNKMGTAPGMVLEKADTVFVFMPGVPMEMKYIYEHGIIPLLKNRFELPPVFYRTILTAGVGESVIAEQIEDLENGLPDGMSFAYLPGLSQVRIRVTARGYQEAQARTLVDEKVRQITDILGDMVFGYDDTTLSEQIGNLLKKHNKTLTLAESCTGGYLAHLITQIPGASDYFVGGIVSYSNEMKISELGVSPDTLQNSGAVSEATVIEMAKGALNRYDADVALAISGIAGPGGGSKAKPVGTIWLCVTGEKATKTKLIQLHRDREINIKQAGVIALNMIRKFLSGSELA